MTLFLVHTAVRYSESSTMYCAYIVVEESVKKAEKKLRDSGKLQDDAPLEYEDILRTEILEIDADNPGIALIHFGAQTVEL